MILSRTVDTLFDSNFVNILRSQFVRVIGLQFSIFSRFLPALGSNVIHETL